MKKTFALVLTLLAALAVLVGGVASAETVHLRYAELDVSETC